MPTPIARSRANLNATPLVNPFYEVLEAEFDNVFSNTYSLVDYFDPSLYVCDRTSSATNASTERLLLRLPKDVHSAVKLEKLGHAELDLLDFILNYKTAKVCSVVGSVGTGKSTFLKYFAFYLQEELPSLQNFRIIYLDFFNIHEFDNRPRFIFQIISTNILNAFRNTAAVANALHSFSLVEEITAKFANSGDLTTIDISSYVIEVRKAVGLDLVFIFDNLDLLDPDNVVDVTAFARSLYFSTNQAAIIALRPSTDTIRVEFARDKSAFFPFVLNIAPPRLSWVIWKRFEKVIRNVERTAAAEKAVMDAYGFTISISNVSYRVRQLFENVLTADLQDILLRKICNNNLRRALIAFKNFVRHRGLSFKLIFDFSEIGTSRRGSVAPTFSHFLEGVMTGDRRCYSEEWRDSVVANLYYFSPPEIAYADHIIQYYCLAVLGLLDKRVSFDRLFSYLMPLQYSPAVVRRCVVKLLEGGLLSSPEGVNQGWPRHLVITETGKYYLEQLCTDTDYVLNLTPDIDIPFTPPHLVEATHFSARYQAFKILMGYVVREEIEALAKVQKASSGAIPIRLAICKYSPISTRLWNSFKEIKRRNPRNSESKARIIESRDEVFLVASTEYKEHLSSIEQIVKGFAERGRVNDLEAKIPIEEDVLGLGRVELVHPPLISGAAPNRIEVAFLPSFRITATEIVGEWYAEEGSFYTRRMFYMKRDAQSRGPFRGSFEVDHEGADIHFPTRSTITFFEADATLGAMELKVA